MFAVHNYCYLADRPCSGHAHFSIPVVDELLNIPIDVVFDHCFTDSALYRDFVTNKKTFGKMIHCDLCGPVSMDQ
jgi:hypothetical protein